MAERDYLYAIFGYETFVKIKPAFNIGKVLFAFVNKKTKEYIDCYIDLLDYEELLEQIRLGEFRRLIAEEKNKGQQYPKAIWDSGLGGTSKGGKTIFRKFSIAPGARQYAVFTAECGPANHEDGLYAPIKKNPDNQSEFKAIRVGVMNYAEFRKMMLESNKYLNIWYETVRKAQMQEELQTMMRHPAEDETSTPMNTVSSPVEKEPVQTGQVTTPSNLERKESDQPLQLWTDTFRSKSTLAQKDSMYYLHACRKQDQQPIPVVFVQEQIRMADPEKWQRFIKGVSEKIEIPFSIRYTMRGNKILFAGFA